MNDLPNWLIPLIEILGGGMFLFVSYFVTTTMKEIRETMKSIRQEQSVDRANQLKIAEKLTEVDKTVTVHEFRIKEFARYSDSTHDTLKVAKDIVLKLQALQG